MIRFILISLLLTSFALAKGGGKGEGASLRILSTNMENFFDAEHDAGKEDYTYLPLAVKKAMPEAMSWCGNQTGVYRQECFNLDWTQAKFEQKAARIATVIKGVFAPAMPDVIAVQEVENIKALTLVAKNLGPDYQALLIEGPDERGIDTGIITRLKVVSTKLHSFATTSGRPTRGILEAVLNVGSSRVTFFANHWPSQSNPDENRMNAGQTLLSVAKLAQAKSDLVIAAGDFNTADDDVLNALKTYIEPNFYDVEAEARAIGVQFPTEGTYSHQGVWGSLDHIFLMKGTRMTRSVDFTGAIIYTDNGRMIESYSYRGQTATRPIRYNSTNGTGYSDHLPFGMVFKL